MSSFDVTFVAVVTAAFVFYGAVLFWGINQTSKLFTPWR